MHINFPAININLFCNTIQIICATEPSDTILVSRSRFLRRVDIEVRYFPDADSLFWCCVYTLYMSEGHL